MFHGIPCVMWEFVSADIHAAKGAIAHAAERQCWRPYLPVGPECQQNAGAPPKCRARNRPASGPVLHYMIADMASGMPSIPVMIIANDIPNPLNM